MKRVVYIIMALTLVNVMHSQTEERKWNIGAHAGFIQYAGDRGQSFYRFNQAAYGFGGISVSRYLSRRCDLLFFSSTGEVGNRDVVREARREAVDGRNSFLARQHTVTVGLRYNFVDAENYVRPFVFLGPSVMFLEERYSVEEPRFDFLIPTAAAGVNFRINAIIALELRETFMYLSSDDLDFKSGGLNDAFLYHTAGINFNLKRSYISPKQQRLPKRTLFKK